MAGGLEPRGVEGGPSRGHEPHEAVPPAGPQVEPPSEAPMAPVWGALLSPCSGCTDCLQEAQPPA
eukprot:7545459-Lingulodinium_polyedra.AAC.1